jgi:hypothetical protein
MAPYSNSSLGSYYDGRGDGSYMAGSFYSGSCYTAMPYWTATGYGTATTSYIPIHTESDAERKRRLKLESEAERKERERLANRTLADLDDDDKEELMTIINDFYKQYKHEEEVKQLMSGVKWFLIFLGLAILWNFPTILALIAKMIK